MNKLSIEEKAKAYDKALAIARDFYNSTEYAKSHTEVKATYEAIFPELKESEDEKISKEIIDIINSYDVYHLKVAGLPSRIPEYIAWLEAQCEYANFRNKIQIGDKVTRNEDGVLVNLSQLKRVAKKDDKQGEQKPINIVTILDDYFANTPKEQQDKDWEELKHLNNFGWELVEQKPAEWSKEDEFHFKSIESAIEYCKKEVAENDEAKYLYNEDLNWFKVLKDKVQPQPKQEWSEEDKYNQAWIVEMLYGLEDEDKEYEKECRKMADWLKSLRPQSQWKPSDEQMEALLYEVNAWDEDSVNGQNLKSLYQGLKELKDEK